MSLGTPGASPVANVDDAREREKQSDHYDFARLTRAVERLALSHADLEADCARLRTDLGQRDGEVHELEARLRQGATHRVESQKRLDQLIARIEEIEALLTTAVVAPRAPDTPTPAAPPTSQTPPQSTDHE